jgi:hypothetical protein
MSHYTRPYTHYTVLYWRLQRIYGLTESEAINIIIENMMWKEGSVF